MTRHQERAPRGLSDGALSTAGLAQIAHCDSESDADQTAPPRLYRGTGGSPITSAGR